jgi:hypothetical protein
VLSTATGDIAKKQTQRMMNWYKFIVQSPHHKGGHAITPTSSSGLGAFYSATAKCVTLLGSLSHGGWWNVSRTSEMCFSMMYSVSAVFEYLEVEEDMNFIVQCLLIAVIA